MVRMWGVWKTVHKDQVAWLCRDKEGPQWTAWTKKARVWRYLNDARQVAREMGDGARAGAIEVPKGDASFGEGG